MHATHLARLWWEHAIKHEAHVVHVPLGPHQQLALLRVVHHCHAAGVRRTPATLHVQWAHTTEHPRGAPHFHELEGHKGQGRGKGIGRRRTACSQQSNVIGGEGGG
jgi:hypothetical protein